MALQGERQGSQAAETVASLSQQLAGVKAALAACEDRAASAAQQATAIEADLGAAQAAMHRVRTAAAAALQEACASASAVVRHVAAKPASCSDFAFSTSLQGDCMLSAHTCKNVVSANLSKEIAAEIDHLGAPSCKNLSARLCGVTRQDFACRARACQRLLKPGLWGCSAAAGRSLINCRRCMASSRAISLQTVAHRTLRARGTRSFRCDRRGSNACLHLAAVSSYVRLQASSAPPATLL